MSAPRGLPARIWVVVRPTGERDYLDKEPLEGIAAWAKGLNATIAVYPFGDVIHMPPPAKKKVPTK